MAAPAKDRREVLSDSEATLRQVRGVLEDLGTSSDDAFAEVDEVVTALEDRPTGLQDLMSILTKTYAEIVEVGSQHGDLEGAHSLDLAIEEV